MLALAALFCFSLLLISVLVLFYQKHYRSSAEQPVILLFIDAPDPDNPAAALALIKHLQPSCLHIILTGRPVDFHTGRCKSTMYERHCHEKFVMNHSVRLLEDSAARLSTYFDKCNIGHQIKLYNGGIAPCAPLSDAVHDWDFLYDRKDLITMNGCDKGEILSPEQYEELVLKYNAMSKGRREREFLSIMRYFHLIPLDNLKREILRKSCQEIIVYIGGPTTAVPHVFDSEVLRLKVTNLYGMFGALEPGKGTLLKNQFNVACDIESACQVFVKNMFPKIKKFLITTETAKMKPLIVSSHHLKEYGAFSHIVELQLLWESTHKNKEQPLFDVIPVMASLEKYKSYFMWSEKKAVLKDNQFCLLNSNSSNLLVSHDFVGNNDLYIDFLVKLWY